MPQWEQVVSAELYDHSEAESTILVRDGRSVESANVATYALRRSGILRQRLRAHFDNVLKAAA